MVEGLADGSEAGGLVRPPLRPRIGWVLAAHGGGGKRVRGRSCGCEEPPPRRAPQQRRHGWQAGAQQHEAAPGDAGGGLTGGWQGRQATATLATPASSPPVAAPGLLGV